MLASGRGAASATHSQSTPVAPPPRLPGGYRLCDCNIMYECGIQGSSVSHVVVSQVEGMNMARDFRVGSTKQSLTFP